MSWTTTRFEGNEASRRRDEQGFTLVELLVSTMVSMLALFVTLALLDLAVKSEPDIADRNVSIQEAEVALERMTREVRQAYEVVAASSTDLTILTYANRAACGSNQLDTARPCRVVYSCAGGDCTRTASEEDGSGTGPSQQIVSGLSSDSVFTYEPSPSDARAVGMTLSFPAAGGSGNDDAITVTDGAVMRNLTEVLNS